MANTKTTKRSVPKKMGKKGPARVGIKKKAA
jgi:hypothetical protein